MATFKLRDPGLEYPFSSFDLSNPFSQVLHVECSFEPGRDSSFSSSFKQKSILCSDSDSEAFTPGYATSTERSTGYPDLPRTHFRPISASELSPGGRRESEFESEPKQNVPIASQIAHSKIHRQISNRWKRTQRRRPLLWEVRAWSLGSSPQA